MKIDPYCHRQYCSQLTALRRKLRPIDCVDIAGRSSARMLQRRVGWRKHAVFELNASISRNRQEIRPKLLLVTNRKLFFGTKSMTMN